MADEKGYDALGKLANKPEEKKVEPGLDEKGIKGEPGTGFESRIVDGVDKGPFECHNCTYMEKDGDGCEQKDMKAKSKRPRNKRGLPIVEKRDCCEYVDRMGKGNKEKGSDAGSVSGKAPEL